MSTPSVQVETRGAVALVTLNRPDNGNALNLEMGMDLLAAAMTCGRNPAVRAVVLTGAGRQFCLGGDLRAMASRGAGVDGYLRELTGYLHSAISHFVRMDAPVIAAVNGAVAGAGVGLVAMADLAVCGESPKFSLAYTGVGLTPDGGTSFLLPRTIGIKRTMELMLLNRALTSGEALQWGLVNSVVEDSQVVDEALRVAERLSAGPRRRLARRSACWRLRLPASSRKWCSRARPLRRRRSRSKGRRASTPSCRSVSLTSPLGVSASGATAGSC